MSLGTPQGFPCGSAGKESTCNAGNLGSIPGLGGSPGEGKGHPLQYSGLENSTDCIVHGVANSRTRLSVFHSLTVDSSTTLSLSQRVLYIVIPACIWLTVILNDLAFPQVFLYGIELWC